MATAGARDSRIVLCVEYAKKLYETLGDKANPSDGDPAADAAAATLVGDQDGGGAEAAPLHCL